MSVACSIATRRGHWKWRVPSSLSRSLHSPLSRVQINGLLKRARDAMRFFEFFLIFFLKTFHRVMHGIQALLCNAVIAIISRSLCARAMQFSWLHYQQVTATAAAAVGRSACYLNPLNRCRSDSPLCVPSTTCSNLRCASPHPPASHHEVYNVVGEKQ